MNKLLFIVVGLSTASLAVADNRLFPSDILNQGEADTRLGWGQGSVSGDVSSNGVHGRQSTDITTEFAQIRYGLGYDWQVGLGLQYDSKNVTHTKFSNPPVRFTNNDSEGGQNPEIWASYGVVRGNDSPFTLSAQFMVSPDTTGNQGVAYTGRLLAGWRHSETLRFYGILSEVINRDGAVADSTSIDIGAYQDVSEKITLIPHLGYADFRSTNDFSSTSRFDIGLSSDIQICNNTYLIPDVSFLRYSSGHTKDDSFHRDSTSNGNTISLGLYHLF